MYRRLQPDHAGRWPGHKNHRHHKPGRAQVVDYNYIGLNAAGTDALLGVNFPGAIWVVASDQNTIGHLPASRSALAEQGIAPPQNLICIQDVDRGDYVQFDDQTGAYSWKECRSGRADSGIGTVSTSISGHIVLRSSTYMPVSISQPVRGWGGSNTLVKAFLTPPTTGVLRWSRSAAAPASARQPVSKMPSVVYIYATA